MFFDAEAGAPWATAPYGAEDLPKIARMLATAEIRPGAWVLEPGCGTGRVTEILADAVGPEGRVVALDISRRMVEACRRRVESRGNVQVVRAAVEELTVKAKSFDRVICHQVFPHFDDKVVALTTLERVLKPQGRLLVVHFTTAAEINDRHRKAGTVVEGDLMPAPQEMRRLFEEAGLAIESLSDDRLGYLVCATRMRDARGE